MHNLAYLAVFEEIEFAMLQEALNAAEESTRGKGKLKDCGEQ